MRVISLFLLFLWPTLSFADLSFGDKSDNCNFSSAQTLTKSVWNCDDLIVASGVTLSFSSTLTSRVVFQVQGVVTIEGSIDVSATDADGTASNGDEAPGPGGYSGGECSASVICNATGGSASGTNAGGGGLTGVTDNVGHGGGGGGAGGAYRTAPSAGTAGGSSVTSAAGAAGTAGSPISVASTFSSATPGGAGGGAGGSGQDSGSNYVTGGRGGAGAGALVIVSKGRIVLDATGSLLANGGDGGDGSVNAFVGSGGGGGGSGGAIYLISLSSVTLDGSVNVNGGASGTGGAAGVSGGNGGAGGLGQVRVDSSSGSYSGSTVIPGVYQSTPPTNITDPFDLNFESDIDYGCSYKAADSERADFLIAFLIGLLFMGPLWRIGRAIHHRR